MPVTNLPGTDLISKVGLIADTHGRLEKAVAKAFRGVDLILHAGDIGNPEILRKLGVMAPVVAVRGNMDAGSWALDLPTFELIEIAHRRVYVIHDIQHLDLDLTVAGISAVVSGHIHKPVLKEHNEILFINPGSASQPRFHQSASVALLYFHPHSIRVEFIELN